MLAKRALPAKQNSGSSAGDSMLLRTEFLSSQSEVFRTVPCDMPVIWANASVVMKKEGERVVNIHCCSLARFKNPRTRMRVATYGMLFSFGAGRKLGQSPGSFRGYSEV